MIPLFISFEEGFFIILVAVLILGPKKIPEIARNLGEGVRQLRNAIQEIKQEIWKIGEKGEEMDKEAEKEVQEIEQEFHENFSGSVKRGS